MAKFNFMWRTSNKGKTRDIYTVKYYGACACNKNHHNEIFSGILLQFSHFPSTFQASSKTYSSPLFSTAICC